MRVPLVTSHAACKGHAPENTLPGIERALALGADAIEIDVQTTSDGVPVLLHDELVDRTTDGTGSVREMALGVVRTLDAGAKQFAPEFQGALVPLLAEAIDLTNGKALLQVEVKHPGAEREIVDVVHRAGAIAHCEFHSFYPPVVRALRELEPRMAAVLLTVGNRVVDWEDFWGFALALNAQGVSVHHAHVTPERVRRGQLRGLTFMTWTVDEEPEIAHVLDAGVDSVCSNYPDVVRRCVDGRLPPGGPPPQVPPQKVT